MWSCFWSSLANICRNITMHCDWLNGRFEIYFALYFFARQFILPLIVEYIRAVKYAHAVLPDEWETPPQNMSFVDISLQTSCMGNDAPTALLNTQHEIDTELLKVRANKKLYFFDILQLWLIVKLRWLWTFIAFSENNILKLNKFTLQYLGAWYHNSLPKIWISSKPK